MDRLNRPQVKRGVEQRETKYDFIYTVYLPWFQSSAKLPPVQAPAIACANQHKSGFTVHPGFKWGKLHPYKFHSSMLGVCSGADGRGWVIGGWNLGSRQDLKQRGTPSGIQGRHHPKYHNIILKYLTHHSSPFIRAFGTNQR